MLVFIELNLQLIHSLIYVNGFYLASEMTQPIVDDPVRDFTRTLPPDAELVEALRSASRYCQVRVTHEWLLEAVKKFVVKNVQYVLLSFF